MTEQTPDFSATPLEDSNKPAAKPKRRHAPARAKTTRRKSDTGLSSAKKQAKDEAVSQQLTAIYKDTNGEIPNMRTIEMKKGGGFFRKLFGLIVVLGLLAAAAWAGFFMMPGQNSGTTPEAVLTISGDASLTLGATTTITINYANNQKVNLNNATISLRYPAGFMFIASEPTAQNDGHTEWDLGTLAPKQKGEITITGKMYSPAGEVQGWRAFLSYQPDNFQSNLQTMATFENKVALAPYTLSLAVPDKIQTGMETTLTITVENNNENWPDKLVVTPNFPANFYLTSSTPKLSKNNWPIVITPSSTPSAVYTITVSGKLSDQDEPTAVFKADLSYLDANSNKQTIASAAVNTEVAKNALTLAVAVNGSTAKVSTKPADLLGITLSIKNAGKTDITNAMLNLKIDAPSYQRQSALDWAELNDKYDGDVKGTQVSDTVRRGEITWTTKHWPDLKTIKVGQELTLDINLPVKNLKGIDWSKITANTGTLIAQITYTNEGKQQALTTAPVTITFNSDLAVQVRDEATGNTHAINWVITNNIHPLKDVTLSADVYGDATVSLPDSAPAGTVAYDKTNNQIVWTIPEVNENMDVLALPFTITLNTVNPTQNVLVSKVRVQATDATTGEQINFMADEIGLKATQ